MDEEQLAALYPELYTEESPSEYMSIITAEIIQQQTINRQIEEQLFSED